MNIFDARKLQKYLYLYSDAKFKRTRINTFQGELIYVVYHLIAKENIMYLDDDLMKNICNRKLDGMTYYITYLKVKGLPNGMYFVETIDVD